MRSRSKSISGSRTLAMATALVVHGSALLLLLVPERPDPQARALDAATEAIFLVPPPKPPPPPPPVVTVKPLPALRPVPHPQPPPPMPTPATRPAATDPPVISDYADSEPPTPPGPDLPAISAARVDARYGQSNRLKYPVQALRQHEQGRLQLRVLIDADGKVQKVAIERSSGSPRLDQAALQSVRQWRFVPAQRDGQGIASWVIVPIEFSLGSG